MKTLRIILIVIVTSFTFYSNAQTSTIPSNVHELLQNKTWTYKGKPKATEIYTATTYKVYYDGVFGMEEPYYISETEVEEGNFDSSKVGNSIMGKYFVTPTGCYEIIKISETELEIRNIKHTHTVVLITN